MARKIVIIIAGLLATAAPAAAQVDPLLFIKDTQPYVLFVVDTANRMQRDAPSDPVNWRATSSYYDPYIYSRTASAWETTLGLSGTNTTTNYRRKYYGLTYAGDNAATSSIRIVTDKDVTVDTAPTPSPPGIANYSLFGAPTRIAVARAAIAQAIKLNQSDVLFGLIRMRQKNPAIGSQSNTDAIAVPAASQSPNTEKGTSSVLWKLTRPDPGSQNNASGPNNSVVLVHPTDTSANAKVQQLVGLDVRGTQRGTVTVSGYSPAPLLPAGIETTATMVDAPIKYMLDDAKAEAASLISTDTACTNTIVVLIVGGGEGNTSSLDPATAASGFLNVASGRRVPIYVIAIAPPSADVTQLKAIAANSGGQYFEITKAHIDAALTAAATMYSSPIAGTVIVPEVVNAINTAVQHGLAAYTDVNTAPSVALPYGPSTEFPAASPIIGSVNLEGAKDITGATLPNTIVNNKSGTQLPQRSNLLVTTGFKLPGFKGSLRGFRQYKPVLDNTQLSGWKFSADGTRLWVACVPGETGCKATDVTKRNLYTATGAGTVVAFTTANAATLAPLMNLSVADATVVIAAVRNLPIGPFVDSTPAIMNPPSLDPPPDDDYPAFAVANKERRSIVWVGSNHGVLEAIDARLGVEVWGFIPMNLLPKLKMLRLGQPITQFMYMMDGSAKIADVKIDNVWRTHLIMGEGPGGTFYQSFDVTMSDMASMISATSDDVDLVLQYFSNPATISLNWAFPKYTSFDPTLGPYGDVSASATNVEKSVGQTWSDPAVGQVVDDSGPFTVLIGSGFLPYTTQQLANRGGIVAGTTFYVLKAKDGTVLASKDVGSDGVNETIDDCSATVLVGDVKKGKKKNQYGCNQIKNALQSDPVATGPADSRYITKAYMGDLDGRLWRFDIDLDDFYNAKISATTKLFESGNDQPIFSSMATVNVGGSQQYIFFGTGSDLLPSTGISTNYHMLGVLDKGSSGLKTLDQRLAKTDARTMDEKITAFPAVAGDIVFFTTTDFQPATACTAAVANLYAFTFIGGAAYDTTGDGKVSGADTPLVKSITGARATAPFVVDQHLAFGAGNKIALFGDPTAYNNGIGQAGVRILSWREVR